MADTCIVCLGDLSVGEDDATTAPAAKVPDPLHTRETATQTAPELLQQQDQDQPLDFKSKNSPQKDKSKDFSLLENPDLIAHLLPCGHDLHNECLKPWVERANSCPMCRQNFNVVELKTSLSAPCFSSYAVQDKRQVADLDPSMIIEEEIFEDASSEPCLLCEHYGDEELLLLCDGCCASCHTYCAGLDGVPAGPWFCQFCLEDFPYSSPTRSRAGRTLRTRGQQRRLGSRGDQSSDAWARVWQSVWDNLNIDLDFPFSEEVDLDSRTRAQRREFSEWQQRFRIAESHGAGAAARFRDTAATLLEGHQPRAATPHPESQEEIKAWNAFDKAREIESSTASTPQSRSKRKSAPTSPADPPAEPERRLKRPRTRRLQQEATAEGSASSSSHPQPPILNLPHHSASSPPSRGRPNPEGEVGGPSFFQSLLHEVQTKSDDTSHLQAINSGTGLPNYDHSSPCSSSPVSPTPSNHPSPGIRTSSPPPFRPSRPASPPLTSRIEPIFAVQPLIPPLSTASGSASDSEGHSSSRSSSRAPKSARSRSKKHLDATTSLEQTRSMKAEIQQMVSTALKPAYHSREIDSEQFTDINRDISRMLYDMVGEAGGLVDDAADKEKWQVLATHEVEAAVRRLKENDVQALAA